MTSNGKRRVVFRKGEGFCDLHTLVPCGECVGCRVSKARHWAIRCKHEAERWRYSCFVTLTYDEENVPHVEDDLDAEETLRPEDFVLFMKRLRHVAPGVRFFQAGEYGKLGRPHHHALLFNCWFSDAKRWRKRGEHWLYRSDKLEELWPFGFSSFGHVGAGSAFYVASYALKKLGSQEDYGRRVPEYHTMSRRPGIGNSWVLKYGPEVFAGDEVVFRSGARFKPPRYYDDIWKRREALVVKEVKRARVRAVNQDEQRGVRQYARQEVLKARLRAGERDI